MITSKITTRETMLKIQPVNRAGSDESLSQFVRRSVLAQLEQSWKPGMRVPPVRDIAHQFGVAIGTVQQAIKDLVEEGILIARPKLGTIVAPDCSDRLIRARIAEGKRNPRFARSRIEGKSIHVQRVAGTDPMIVEMSEAFRRAMGKRGCRVEIEERPNSVARVTTPGDVDAIVLFQPGPRIDANCEPHQVLLVVSTEHAVQVNLPARYDVLSVDDEQGSFLAGRHLQMIGCKTACFIGARQSKDLSGQFHPTSARRLCGFERGWGGSLGARFQLKAATHDIEPGAEVVREYLKLAPRPDAVFADSDDLAIGFIQGARAEGLIAGRDFQIIGFDKQQVGADLPEGPLTTIEVPRVAMGVRGAELLTARLVEPDQPVHRIYLGCSFFEGKTARSFKAEVKPSK